jgi:hypothetical protein
MALVPNSPVLTPFEPFFSGFTLAYASTTTITVAAGKCSDSTAINVIDLATGVTLNAAVNGLNGLDTGSLANSTHYFVFAIGDSTQNNPSGVLLSTSATTPYLPGGYDMIRRIGAVLTDGSAHIRDFTQRGFGLDRAMWYADAIATNITAGASTSFAAVTASASAPSVAKELFLKSVLTADAGATRTAAFKATSSSSTAGQAFTSSPASTVTTASVVCPCDASGAISYLVSNAAAAIAISVSGYLDSLA